MFVDRHCLDVVDGPAARLRDRFVGPYKIVAFLSPVICKLDIPDCNGSCEFHVAQLWLAKESPSASIPQPPAGISNERTGENEFEIEKIIGLSTCGS